MSGIRETPQERGWRYSINYGPEGEANYAMVYDAKGDLVGNLKTYHAIAVVNAANAMAAISVEKLLAAYDAESEMVPLGHENISLGASTYSWRRTVTRQLRALHSVLTAVTTAELSSGQNLADANTNNPTPPKAGSQ